MNELKGKFVNIVLSVEEGRGFDLVKCPFFVTANFNGRKMDSDIVEGANVVFSTEMVWETEKKLLRKARGSYANIRLECMTSDRKLLGFTLLCLRSAKIVPSSKAGCSDNRPVTWTKLLNVPSEFKKSTPEIRVFLLIRDYIPNIPLKSPVLKTNTTPHLPKQLPIIKDQPLRVPVKYADEGFIQVGNVEDCYSKFQLKLTLLIGSDLDVLLPESMIFGNGPKSFHLSVETFGLEVKSRTVTEDVYAPIVVFNESIVINLQSNYSILGIYFKQFPEINIKFYAGQDMMAWTHIDMRKLNLDLPESIFQEYKQYEMDQVCFFEGHYRATSSAEAMRRATVSTECKLAVVDYFENIKQESMTEDTICPPDVAGSSPMSPAGDGLSSGPVQISLTSKQSGTSASVSSLSTIESDDLYNTQYHQFLLEVKVESIIFESNFSSSNCLLKLVHPRVNNHVAKEVVIGEPNKEVSIENALCIISMVGLRSRLQYMMINHLPKVELIDMTSQEVIGRMVLHLTTFQDNNPGQLYITSLKSPTGKNIATLTVSIYAREIENLLAEPTDPFYLPPSILDEFAITYSIAELQQWQGKMREDFLDALELEKNDEMQRLRLEWRDRTFPLQEDLLKNLEKCRTLVERQEKRKQLSAIDREVANRIESQEYNIIMEIHKNSVKYTLADNQELIETISELEVKNAILREMLGEQSTQIQEVKETQLTAEQTKALLRDLKTMEEKFEVAQQDKLYFKKEYEKAMKEVHNLKMDYHKNIASKIASDKQALNTLVACPSLSDVVTSNDTEESLPLKVASDDDKNNEKPDNGNLSEPEPEKSG